jgi:hypothetical protein
LEHESFAVCDLVQTTGCLGIGRTGARLHRASRTENNETALARLETPNASTTHPETIVAIVALLPDRGSHRHYDIGHRHRLGGPGLDYSYHYSSSFDSSWDCDLGRDCPSDGGYDFDSNVYLDLRFGFGLGCDFEHDHGFGCGSCFGCDFESGFGFGFGFSGILT